MDPVDIQRIIETKSLRWIFLKGECGNRKLAAVRYLSFLLGSFGRRVLLVRIYYMKDVPVPWLVEKTEAVYWLDFVVNTTDDKELPDWFYENTFTNFCKIKMQNLLESVMVFKKAIKYADLLRTIKDHNIDIVIFADIIEDIREDIREFLLYPRIVHDNLAELMHDKYDTGSKIKDIPGYNYDVFRDKVDETFDAVVQLHMQWKDAEQTAFIKMLPTRQPTDKRETDRPIDTIEID